MKILAIRIKNLASLEGEFEIDFRKEPLASSGIFAITGPTGAGKSTILDAVCLALFAKTPRHTNKERSIEINDGTNNKMRLGDARGILRKGTGDGYAQVEFAGTDGHIHLATWSVRRARNKPDQALQADTVDLIDLTTNTRFPARKTETLDEIERLAGLNFEQFTRSVLLAQGEFTAFLKAEKSEKSSLLEKLTGTDIYSDISKRIYEKHKAADAEIKQEQAKIAGYVLLLPEEETALLAREHELAEGILAIKAELEQHQDALKWYQVQEELASSTEQAVAALQQATDAKVGAAQRVAYLQQVEQVQDARTLADQCNELAATTAAKATTIQTVERQVATIAGQLQAGDAQVAASREQLRQREQEAMATQPDLDKAKELDTLIRTTTGEITVAEQEAQQLAEKAAGYASNMERITAEIADATQKQTILTDWKTRVEANQPIADNHHLILLQLAEARKQLNQLKKLETDAAGNKDKEQQNETLLASLTEQISTHDAAVQAKERELEGLQQQLANYNAEQLRDENNHWAHQIEQLLGAQGCWQLLYNTRVAYAIGLEKQHQQEGEIQVTSKALEQSKALCAEALAKKDQTRKILDQLQLELAQDVQEMRSHLEDDAPCPVCGSEDHPYNNHRQEIAEGMLQRVKREFTELDTKYSSLLQEKGRLESRVDSLTATIANLGKEGVVLSRDLALMETKWLGYEVVSIINQTPDAEKMAALDGQIVHSRKQQEGVQAALKAYDALTMAIQGLKDSKTTLSHALVTLQESERTCQRNRTLYQHESQRIAEETAGAQAALDDKFQSVHQYFNNPEWKDNWLTSPAIFEARITGFAAEWREKTSSIEATQKHLADLHTTLEQQRLLAKGVVEQQQTAAGKLVGLQHQLGQHASERKLLFGGRATTAVEQWLRGVIEEAKTELEQNQRQADAFRAEASRLQGSLAQQQQEQAAATHKLATAKEQLTAWLAAFAATYAYALSAQELAALLALPHSWLQQERTWLRETEERINTATATLAERQRRQDAHQQQKTSETSREELAASLEQLTTSLNDAAKQKTELEYQLRQHREHQTTVAAIQAIINSKQEAYGNWQKLDELLGSASGEKFRQIAQEFTLDVLLGFANKQIRALASRYHLQRIPGSLALQVVDADMGNEIRSVHSLSGGESFLVSLALALGLASLSSNRMKVESLFIDEGFGTLDEETLVVAMEALDRLHNQGRKVGVITHVREMTERISTKIVVSKLANGKSKLQVVG